jgi:hypothetical protein
MCTVCEGATEWCARRESTGKKIKTHEVLDLPVCKRWLRTTDVAFGYGMVMLCASGFSAADQLMGEKCRGHRYVFSLAALGIADMLPDGDYRKAHYLLHHVLPEAVVSFRSTLWM